MRRVFAAILAAMMLTGCAKVSEEKTSESRFVVVETTYMWQVVADKETGVMYAVSYGMHNLGTFTLLVDVDGKPLLWKGNADADHN